MEYFLVIYQLICGQLSPFSYEGFKGHITFEIVHASFSKPLYHTVANSFSSVLQSCWDQSDSTVATYISLIKTCIRMVTPPQPQPNLIHLEIKVHSTGNKKRMHAPLLSILQHCGQNCHIDKFYRNNSIIFSSWAQNL